MSSRYEDARYRLEDNQAILSRFNWSTNSSYKKCMACVIIAMVFLLLLRDPILKFLAAIPEPLSPSAPDSGRCDVNKSFDVGHVHLIPGSSAESVIVMFSTNVAVKGLLVRYGPTENVEYEAFTQYLKIPDHISHFLFTYTASLTLTLPGRNYYYRITCGPTQSKIFHFQSLRIANNWNPRIVLFSGFPFGIPMRGFLSERRKDDETSLIIQMGWFWRSKDDSDMVMKSIQNSAAHVRYLLLSDDQNDGAVQYKHWFLRSATDGNGIIYTTVGPIQIIGFSAEMLTNSQSHVRVIRNYMMMTRRRRWKYPWLVLVSYGSDLCPPGADDLTDCSYLISLIKDFSIDLFVTGQSDIYHRSWPIGHSGAPLTSYHNIDGTVFVSLGVNNDSVRQNTSFERICNFASIPCAKSHYRPDQLAAELYIRDAANICMHVRSLTTSLTVDDFCIEKRSARLSMRSGSPVVYDQSVLIFLIVTLATVFIVMLIFRQILYHKLCLYINSDGGPPYRAKILSTRSL